MKPVLNKACTEDRDCKTSEGRYTCIAGLCDCDTTKWYRNEVACQSCEYMYSVAAVANRMIRNCRLTNGDEF